MPVRVAVEAKPVTVLVITMHLPAPDEGNGSPLVTRVENTAPVSPHTLYIGGTWRVRWTTTRSAD
jgi:hypothetical protein